MRKHKLSMILMSSASAVMLLHAGAVFAQDADKKDEVVVVTGQRKALLTAQQRKKSTDQIVDSITAVDIGALPDRSVTEALQRVAGVSIGRTNEPRDIDRLNVEGSGVLIRGLTWVRSEINGRDSFGAKGGRALGWEEVTPELAAGVDVYKNPSAEIVEGGLGGTVNLRTWMPFDSKKDKIAFSADATYGDLRKEWTPSGSVLFSKRFDTKLGEMGVLVDIAHSELKSRLNALEVDPYNAHSTTTKSSYDGGTTFNFNANNAIAGQPKSTVYVPTGVQYRNEDRDRTRDGYYAAFQWKPSDASEVYATYFKSKSELINADHFAQTSACCSSTNNQSFMNGPATGTTFTYDSNGMFQTGTIQDGQGGGNGVANSFLLNLGTRYGTENSATQDVSLGYKWHGEKWYFSADLQRIDADHSNNDLTVYNTVTATGGIGLDLTGDLPQISMKNLTTTPSVFNLYAAMDHKEVNEANQTTLKLDGGYDFANNTFLKSFKFGFRATDRESIQKDGGYNWALISAPWAFSATASVDHFPQNQEVVSFDNFFHGDVANPPSLYMPSMSLAQDPSALYAYLQKVWYEPNFGKNMPATGGNDYGTYCSTCGNGTIPSWTNTGNAGLYSPFPNGSLMSYLPIWAGAPVDANNKLLSTSAPVGGNITFWQPFNGNYNIAPTSTSGRGTNRQIEKTQALYGMVRFASDKFAGFGIDWDGNVGVRVVKTQSESTGYGHIASLSLTGSQSQYSAAALQAIKFADGKNYEPTGKGSYTNVLPSLNLRFKPRDDLYIRFAAAKSIVRPDFYQLQPSFNMSGTYQSRPAVVADGVINTQTGVAYTQAQLDAAAAANQTVNYNTGVAFSFFTGNPNLKPMRATQFDLSGEWYFKPGSMFSVGIFTKDIYNYIQSDKATVRVTNNGVTQDIVGTIPQNHGHGTINGAELQFTMWYDFLPGALSGLGTDFNYTVLTTKGTNNTSGNVFDSVQITKSKVQLPLEQLSPHSYNAVLMYNKYGIDARLAYNWRQRYLMAASASNVEAPAFMQSYGQLDGSVMYTINANYKIGLQAANLNGAKSIIEVDQRDSWYYGTQGNTSSYLITKHNWTEADRRISIVLRGTF